MKENISPEEKQRLNELYDLEILDTPYEEAFNEIVELASDICEAPISLISLVDEDRQWFKAKTGLDVPQTSRTVSFCAHALHKKNLFVVPDATKDNRFADNELVTGEPNIRFYAGAPFSSPSGYPLGTICVIDNKPRELTWKQATALKILSHQVIKLLELHSKNKKIAELTAELENKSKKIEELEANSQIENQLCQIQLNNFSKFLLSELEILKTGKFTKKDLSDIYVKAENYEQQIRNFKDGLWVLNEIRKYSKAIPVERIAVNNAVDSISAELEQSCRETSNRISIYIPKDLEIIQYRIIFNLILKASLYYIISNTRKGDIHIVATEKGAELEIRISITNKSLHEDLYKYFLADSFSGNDDNLAFIELRLIKEILTEINGTLELSKLGDEGTNIAFHIPSINTGSI